MIINDIKYITEKEIASMFGMSVGWFRKTRYAQKKLPYYTLNRKVYYNIKEVDLWFKKNVMQHQ